MRLLRPADQVVDGPACPADRRNVRALEVQCRRRHIPAVVETAHEVLRRHANVFEEHLVEVVPVGDVRDPLDRNARCLHVQDESADALVFRDLLVRPGQEQHLVGNVAVRRPDLLSVDDVVVAVADRLGLHAREVRAGSGLAEALAVPGVAGRHPRQIAPLLLVVGVDKHRRPGDTDREEPPTGGCAVIGELFVQDHLFNLGLPQPAVLLRPGGREPAPGAEFLRELAGERHLVFVIEKVVVAFEPGRDLLLQERAQFAAPLFSLGGEFELHGQPPGCRMIEPHPPNSGAAIGQPHSPGGGRLSRFDFPLST